MAAPRRKSWLRRRVLWPLEAVAFRAWIGGCALLPVEAASNLGGWIGRTLGPWLPVNRLGHRNLRIAFPDMPRAERARILRRMWDNLGRTAAEYAHLGTITNPARGRVETAGFEHARLTFEGRVPGIAFSGHFANWEVMHIMVARRARDCTTVVRDPNNPFIHAPLERLRAVGGGWRAPKGTEGARAAMATLKRGGLIAILIDQRMRDGAVVPFFGQPAGTPAAPAQMALRSGAAVYPARLERLGPARFRMTLCPPLAAPPDGDRQARVEALTAAMTRRLETWIAEKPEDWLWVHRRWPWEVYASQETDAGWR